MTLEEAIEILTKDTQHPTAGFMPDLVEAEKLGIAALKAWREASINQRWPSTMRLPGETKE